MGLPAGRKTTPLQTAAYYRDFAMVQYLIQKGADVNLIINSDTTALTSALHSEGYKHLYEDQLEELEIGDGEWSDFYVPMESIAPEATSLRAKAMLELLIDSGANPDLCAREDQVRIDQLLSMSSAECDQLRALQMVVAEPSFPKPRRTSFRNRKARLLEFLRNGFDPKLCCKKEQQRIEEFLSWTDVELDMLDRERTAVLKEQQREDDANNLAWCRSESPSSSDLETT